MAGKDMIVSVVPIKGKYAINQDCINVQKNGCMLFEFIPLEFDVQQNRNTMNWKQKQVYALNVNQLGNILNINDLALSTKDININLSYKVQDNTQKELIIKKSKNQDTLELSLKYITNGGSNVTSYDIQIFDHQFVMARELCRFSLPYLLGWQALESLEHAERDARDERI
ncbi:ssDNA-binding transcriptional regulator [Pseudocohnilembus persalinus]|uniref:SsDNA-binding transcriptional regulator n=1 Tax=Pseudocohnilembus persalinus TaxID=266149 RepID=A0A0V0Q988_PSEPJ|nr:ssDNA-binding transcriptional regulator [Pseudocohnilembus persalinus]|eukprot:KRW98747.1 ssDNA-binding transcriptional regulator [Pseudocohnilembus persalinus]